MFTTMISEKILFTLIGTFLILCLFSIVGCSSKKPIPARSSSQEQRTERVNKALGSTLTEDSKKEEGTEEVNSTGPSLEEMKTELENTKKAKDGVDEKLKSTLKSLEEVETELENTKEEKKQLESDLSELNNKFQEVEKAKDQALQRAETAEKQRDELQKRIALVPQAKIKNVQHKVTRRGSFVKRKGMEISGEFSVSNRKGHKVWVIAYFYFEDGRPLRDHSKKNNYNGQVATHSVFKIKYTNAQLTKTEGFKLFLFHTDFHVQQPADLRFKVRIYDETTGNFLENEPYNSKPFRYNPIDR